MQAVSPKIPTTLTLSVSSIPEISSVAWSSAITGVNPGKHGIFGFTDLAKGSYITTFPNYLALKAPAFWEQDSVTLSCLEAMKKSDFKSMLIIHHMILIMLFVS